MLEHSAVAIIRYLIKARPYCLSLPALSSFLVCLACSMDLPDPVLD